MGLGSVLLRRMEEGESKMMVLARQGYIPAVVGSGGDKLNEPFNTDPFASWLNAGAGVPFVQGGAVYARVDGGFAHFAYVTTIPAVGLGGRMGVKGVFSDDASYTGFFGAYLYLLGPYTAGAAAGAPSYILSGSLTVTAPDGTVASVPCPIDFTGGGTWWFTHDLSANGLASTASVWDAEPPGVGGTPLLSVTATGTVASFGPNPALFVTIAGGGIPRASDPQILLTDTHWDDLFVSPVEGGGSGGSGTFEYDGVMWAETADFYTSDAEAEAAIAVFAPNPPEIPVISFERTQIEGTFTGDPSEQVFDRYNDNVDVYFPVAGTESLRMLVVYDFSDMTEYTSITPRGDPYDVPGTEDWLDGVAHSRVYAFIETYWGVTWVGDGTHDEGFHLPALKTYWNGGDEGWDSLFFASSRDYDPVMIWDIDWRTRDLAGHGATGYYVHYYSDEFYVPTGVTPPTPKFYFEVPGDVEASPAANEYNTVLILIEEPAPSVELEEIVKGGTPPAPGPEDYGIEHFDLALSGAFAYYTHTQLHQGETTVLGEPSVALHRMDPDGTNDQVVDIPIPDAEVSASEILANHFPTGFIGSTTSYIGQEPRVEDDVIYALSHELPGERVLLAQRLSADLPEDADPIPAGSFILPEYPKLIVEITTTNVSVSFNVFIYVNGDPYWRSPISQAFLGVPTSGPDPVTGVYELPSYDQTPDADDHTNLIADGDVVLFSYGVPEGATCSVKMYVPRHWPHFYLEDVSTIAGGRGGRMSIKMYVNGDILGPENNYFDQLGSVVSMFAYHSDPDTYAGQLVVNQTEMILDPAPGNTYAHGIDFTEPGTYWFTIDIAPDRQSYTSSIWSSEPPPMGGTPVVSHSVDREIVGPVRPLLEGFAKAEYNNWILDQPVTLANSHYDDWMMWEYVVTAPDQTINGISISPDETKLAIVIKLEDTCELRVYDIIAGEQLAADYDVVYTGATEVDVFLRNYAWSPDGDRIVFWEED